ncbi:hypothetical protein CYY_006601 [Polysphondylium violaceum]|uniref:Pre-rRNA-processing protein Ipi1 N-terminal domain-containing protein n=1 Tax=Polysphondylium violaceum TaxID=133409 RepID=A0A8J4PRZ8_9MYCE|nr:hypothetical protein CYY_006601 [Polysphondylium violaceum]
MGRSKAKNTKQPSLDFKIKKRKLGKKPPPNPNVTVTTFKSKALNMPGQSIVEEKDDLVNYRNLTLKDLLAKLGHYNDQVKKDAVNGIRDLVNQHPRVLNQHLGSIMNKIVEVINDLDKDVRHCTHQLVSNLLPMLDEVTMSPFIPLFSVYISSGMTHLKTSIRLDSLRLLDIFIDNYPKLISKHCHQIIPNYIDLLRRVAGTSTAATVSLSTSSSSATAPINLSGTLPASQQKKQPQALPKASSLNTRVFILKSLSKLLLVLINAPDLSYATMMSAINHQLNNNAVQNSQINLEQALFENYQQKKVFSKIFSKLLLTNNKQSSTTENNVNPTILETPSELVDFVKVLMPILVECWLEIGPSNPSMSFAILEDLESVLKLVLLLVHCLKDSSSTTELYGQLSKDYIKYFSPHFPFYIGSPSNPESREWMISCSINSTMTQIAGHFLGFSPSEKDVSNPSFQPFLDYIEDCLNGKLVDEKIEGRKGQATKLYVSNLLWIIKLILPSLSADKSKSILDAFIKFDEKCHPHSNPKKSCVFFIKELLDIQSNPLLSKDKSFKEIIEWGLASLPKLLWKLGNSDTETTLMIINILLTVGKDKSKIKQYDSIQNALVPYFFTITKPKDPSTQGKQIYGPFLTLPINIQSQALNLLYYFSSLNKIMIRSLIAVCRSPKLSMGIIDFILDLIHTKYQDLGIPHYIAFCLAITFSITSSTTNNESNLGKRKLNDNDDEVSEVSNDNSIDDNSQKEKVIKKLCWNINTLRLSIPMNEIIQPITAPLISEMNRILESKENIFSIVYLLEIVYSTLNQQNSQEYQMIPKELLEILPNVIFTYLFESTKDMNTSTNIRDLKTSIQFILLDSTDNLFINILNLLNENVKSSSKESITTRNNIYQTNILLLIELMKSKDLYTLLQKEQIKILVKKSISTLSSLENKEQSEKYLIEKLTTESKLLFNE